MDRREMLGALGAGLATGGAGLVAADHEEAKGGPNKFLAPVQGLHHHFCGIHIAKNNPKSQFIVQHYCAPLGEQMHQCVLFDSTEKGAKLLGVEYIIDDKLYRALPAKEKKYWHPHTYEVLGGGLIAPGLSEADELKFMKGLLTTWGKTWHTWPDPTAAVPLGEPLLMWALTGDGQGDNGVIARRDKQFKVSITTLRKKRVAAIGLEVPQIPAPGSIDTVGRQWTASGEDKPTPRAE
jgi:hypothetical protein